MPSTVNKLYSVQAATTNAGTWGAGASHALNEGVIEIIDLNLGGILTLTPGSGGAISLTSTQARYAMVRLSGVLTGNPAYTSANIGFYMVENVTSGSFTTTWTNGVGSAITIEQSHRYLLFADATNGVRIISNVDLSGLSAQFPAGTVGIFVQAAAPTGWTITGAFNNHGLVFSNTSGGSTSGSVDFTTLFARTATDSYTLTTTDIPAHTHTGSGNTSIESAAHTHVFSHAGTTATQSDNHTHTFSGTTATQSDNHTHTFSGTTSGQSQSHTHSYNAGVGGSLGSTGLPALVSSAAADTGAASQDHTHTYSGTTSLNSVNHTHAYSGTTSINSVNHTHAYSFSGSTGTESANHFHSYSFTTSSTGGGGGHVHNIDMRLKYAIAIPCVKS